MKILYINGLHTGGTKVVVENIIHEMAKSHEVFLFCGVEEHTSPRFSMKDQQVENVLTRQINIRRSRNARIRKNYHHPRFNQPFLDFIERIRPDVIHFHSIQPLGATLVEETLKLSIPFCVTMHDWWWFCPRFYLTDINMEVCSNQEGVDPLRCYCVKRGGFEIKRYEYLKGVLEKVKFILVPSPYMKARMVAEGVDSERIFVNQNGIVPSRTFERKPVGNIVTFGFFGGGAAYKGFHILLQALRQIKTGKCIVNLYNFKVMSEIQDRNNFKNLMQITRHICEKLFDEPYDKFHQMVRQFKWRRLLRSSENVHINFFPSFPNNELDRIFSSIDVLLLPSVMRESFSLSVREAMIRGIPVITSDCGSPEEIVRDGVNGYVFSTSDYKMLGQKMAEMISNPRLIEEFSRHIDKGNIATVKEQGVELESIYGQIIASRNAFDHQ